MKLSLILELFDNIHSPYILNDVDITDLSHSRIYRFTDHTKQIETYSGTMAAPIYQVTISKDDIESLLKSYKSESNQYVLPVELELFRDILYIMDIGPSEGLRRSHIRSVPPERRNELEKMYDNFKNIDTSHYYSIFFKINNTPEGFGLSQLGNANYAYGKMLACILHYFKDFTPSLIEFSAANKKTVPTYRLILNKLGQKTGKKYDYITNDKYMLRDVLKWVDSVSKNLGSSISHLGSQEEDMNIAAAKERKNASRKHRIKQNEEQTYG